MAEKRRRLLLGGTAVILAALGLGLLSTYHFLAVSPQIETITFCDNVSDFLDCYGKRFSKAEKVERWRTTNPISKNAEGVKGRTVRWNLEISNPEKAPVEKIDIWVYLPPDAGAQQLISAKVSTPVAIVSDSMGNRIAHMCLTDVAAFESRIVQFLFYCRYDTLRAEAPEPDGRYLLPEKMIETHDSGIADLAKRLAGETPEATVGALFDYVVKNIESASYDETDHGAVYALSNHKGDCTEMAFLFTALCRAAGIPARVISGYVAAANRVVTAVDLHNWAEYYDGKTWKLADPFYQNLNQNPENYVAVSLFRGDGKTPVGKYHTFRYDAHGHRLKIAH